MLLMLVMEPSYQDASLPLTTTSLIGLKVGQPAHKEVDTFNRRLPFINPSLYLLSPN